MNSRQFDASDGDFVEKLPWKKVGTAILSLPLFGLTFCVIYSILYHFNEANSTHCGVWNFFPSISAAAGSREPQISVWWWSLVLHTPPRYFIVICYLTYYTTRSSQRWKDINYPWIIICSILNSVEITALLLLTLVSSTSDFGIHKSSFITFIITSVAYMISTIKVHSSLYNHTAKAKIATSLRYKKIFFLINILSLFGAGYFYWRHNAYCEPMVYSMFSLSEYSVVLTNIAFHSTMIIDFTPTGISDSSLTLRRRISLDIL